MTISSSTRKAGPFNGNDSTTAFPFTFKVFAKTDITVTLTSTAGVESTLVLDSDYSVALNADQDVSPGGTVTYPISGDELATGEKLTLSGDLAELQPTALTNGGGFFPRVIEYALDRLVIFAQQLREEANRSIKFPVSDGSLTVELPTATVRANKLVGFDADGNVQAVAPDAQSATALQNLLADTDGASYIGYGASTVEDELDSLGNKSGIHAISSLHKNFAYDYTTNTIVVRDGSSDTYHRHFGGIAEGVDGRLHLVYRRASEHGITDGATVYYCYSDDGGKTWSAETVLVASASGFDNREQSIGVTPTGRVVVIYNKCVAPSAAPTVIKLLYSDDNGTTWTAGTDILTVNYAYARTYGRIKLIPGNASVPYRLVFTPYYQVSASPTYKLAAWYSEDDGLTWTEGAPLQDEVNGHSECELVAINAYVWFAVARGSGLNLYVTTDSGATWADIGQVPTTDGVAPTLDKFEYKGRWYLLLGYCDRSLDDTIFKIASVEDALTDPEAFGAAMTVATDMVNASGYQSTVVKPDGSVYIDGGTAYVEFKEYVGFDYSQVRFVRIDLFELARDNARVLTIASGAVTMSTSELDWVVSIDTEAAAATDDLDTINGGYDGQIVRFQGPQTSSTRDVTFKNGTGNLLLTDDFRANTTDSKITLQKAGANWIELGRTNDHTRSTATIAAGVITVPNSRYPIMLPVDTEAAAATDDLDTINGGFEGQIITLFCPSSSRDVTFKDGTGNLNLAGDFTSTNGADRIVLQKQAVTWYEISRSDNA